MHRSRVAAGVAVSILALAGCGATASPEPGLSGSAATDPRLEEFYNQKVTWADCADGFMCGGVKVPLSYQDPGADWITLKVNRLAASNPAKRIGSLVLQPGGPGASGVDYAAGSKNSISQGLRDVYDIVGFDPRGVGASDPIRCLDPAAADRFLAVMGTPFSPTQTADVVNVSGDFGKSCLARSPRLTPNIGTVPAVKDLDILRGALGEAKLNYLGKSYGTFMGLTYVGEFPANVGRFVLDGIIDTTLTNEQLSKGQAEGFQLALDRFINDCIRRVGCPLPKNPKAALAKINEWLQTLATKPIKAALERPLTRPLAINGLIGSMYEPSTQWSALRRALAAGFAGNGLEMLTIVDEFVGRQPNGTYDTNLLDALYAVNCLDRPDRLGLVGTQSQAADFAAAAPTFGSDFAWANLPCAMWPVPATDMPHDVTGAGAGPILLLGTINDPATPYKWAVAASKHLTNATLLTWTGDGHTAYGRGSTCVDAKVDSYLLAGTVPASGQTCL